MEYWQCQSYKGDFHTVLEEPNVTAALFCSVQKGELILNEKFILGSCHPAVVSF
jgi:hypothetical protein